MKKTVLVLGGTGKMGVPVARHLQKDGFPVRIMTRNEEKARKLFDESFEDEWLEKRKAKLHAAT
ncbi:MAG: NmrA family NAD(P)-binding protein [bacterium]